MRISEVLLLDFDNEISNTRRTLQRLPDAIDPEWAPHEKSMKVGRLAMHCATIPLFGHYILEDEGMDLADSKRPHVPLVWRNQADTLNHLEEAAAKCKASLERASDEALMTPWRFTYGPQLIAEAPRAAMFRGLFFNHMVHHAAQLGVYLRLLNFHVPGLYGPSADEPFAAASSDGQVAAES